MKKLKITEKQLAQFNKMRLTLRRIAKLYMTPSQIDRHYKTKYSGMSPVEALEMSYENMQNEAKSCIKGIRELENAS